jgi:hypothetical protein
MAIPALVNGLHPPGVYPAELQEVWDTFDQPGSTTRTALNRALAHTVTLIWTRDMYALVYVNGSYVTDRVDPVDVDLAVRSDAWTDSSFQTAFVSAHPGEEHLVDFFFSANQSAQRMEELFQETQGSPIRKGIILLHP